MSSATVDGLETKKNIKILMFCMKKAVKMVTEHS